MGVTMDEVHYTQTHNEGATTVSGKGGGIYMVHIRAKNERDR